jgi:hypothetical protein
MYGCCPFAVIVRAVYDLGLNQNELIVEGFWAMREVLEGLLLGFALDIALVPATPDFMRAVSICLEA